MSNNPLKDKRFLIAIAVGFVAIFLGAFVAFYVMFYKWTHSINYVADGFSQKAFILSPENMFRDFDKGFEKTVTELNTTNKQYLSNVKEFNMPDDFLSQNNFSALNVNENQDNYILKLNLKPFGNDANNVKTDIKDNKIIISANYKNKDKNNLSSATFYQSLSLPKKITFAQMKKTAKDGFLTITVKKQ